MKKVLVLAEQRDGELEQVSLELLGEARRLLARRDGEIAALLFGHDIGCHALALGRHGAQKVFLVDDARLEHYDPCAWLASMERLCLQQRPDFVFLPATSSGEDLAARLAVARAWPLVARCNRVKFVGDSIETTRQVYGGKLQETTRPLAAGPLLVTVLPGVCGLRAPLDPAEGQLGTTVSVAAEFAERPAVRVTGFAAADPATLDLAEADVVVAAGRGLGAADKVGLVRELAVLLGGVVASTRVVVDIGWLGRETQVGQTGRTVKPRLYVACGVSGATQHTVGMKESGAVVAINTDPAAPIFKIADLALNADVTTLLPALIARCRQRGGHD